MSNPLVSCLCVTEDREKFIPWLLWNYDRQDWPNKELIIIDSSEKPLTISNRNDIKIVYTDHKSTLGLKRNIALEHANGEFVAWFDDDDWQHPKRLTYSIEQIGNNKFIGSQHGYFVDFLNNTCKKIKSYNKPFFNGTLFSRDYIKSIGFQNKLHGIEATALMNDINISFGKILNDILFFWLTHPTNIENPRGKWLMDETLQAIENDTGPFWGDTFEQLKILSHKVYNAS